MSDLQNRIKQLKQEKNAVILAHYYVHDEVQEIADYIGDSFYLSKVATKTDADTIVFCRSRPSCCAAWSLWARAPKS